MLAKLFITLCRIPRLQKRLWHGWYQYLARHYRAAGWTFMNYGFNDPASRVLKPGGHFLYADFRSRDSVDSWRQTLTVSGLTIRAETDITSAVIRGLDSDDDRKRAIIERAVPKILHNSIRDFAALRGSKMYNAFLSGSL